MEEGGFVCMCATSGRRVLVARGFIPTLAAITPSLRQVGRSAFLSSSSRGNRYLFLDEGRSIRSPTTTCMRSSSSTLPTAVEHPAYDLIAKDVVNEYGYDCTLYRHKTSGAELLSVVADDDNKVFGITFRTPPSDSTDLLHILEHSVLGGSRK